MTSTFIDISDAQLGVYQDGNLVRECPGVAHLGKAGVAFGHDALAISRHEPRELMDKYWAQLDSVPLAKPHHAFRHHADLAYRQLSMLVEEIAPIGDVYFIVPSAYRRKELQLLLGIAKALELNVASFIDRSVASIAALEVTTPHAQFIDLSFHRTCVSQVSITDKVSFINAQTLERVGKVYLNELALNWIADSFLDQARFDPLAHAATEQALFDELMTWLASLRNSEHINIGLDFHGRRHEVSLSKVDLISTLKPGIELIASAIDKTTPTILSSQFACYPAEVRSVLNAKLTKPLDTIRYISTLFSGQESNQDEVRLFRSLAPRASQTLAAVTASDGA